MFMRNIASFCAIELNTSTSESNVISSADICITPHLLERSSDTSQLVLASQSCPASKDRLPRSGCVSVTSLP